MRQLLFIAFTASFFFAKAQANFELINLGPKVNTTEFTECYPCFAADGQTLYFSRDLLSERGYEIFYSTLDPEKKWTAGKPIPELNNALDNAVFYVTPDGETLYLSGQYEGKASEDGISVTHRQGDGWSKPELIHFEDESLIKSSNISITLSSDNQVMIICLPSNQFDYYVCFNQGNNNWSAPLSLDTTINTKSYEYSPFLAPDNKTLYFSSGGHGGEGLNDIFKSTRLDDSWVNWSEPENMGKPINSSNWESFFAISAKGDKAIVYSLKEGNGDLFYVGLSENMKPQPTLLLTGKVLNSKTQQPIQAEIYFEDLGSGEKIGMAKTDRSGFYKMILTSGKKYGLFAQAEGYIPVNENIDVIKIDQYTEVEKNLFMAPIEVGQTILINNVFFDFGQSTLKKESFPELLRLISVLKSYPNMVIQIAGHTDNVGADADNLKLSQDRANAVRDYLTTNGIESSRISAVGFGETKPKVNNDTDQNRQLNRRVEFSILKK